jgi:hypothetical protein
MRQGLAQAALTLERGGAGPNNPPHQYLGLAVAAKGPAAVVLQALTRMRSLFDDVARAAGAMC